MASGELPLDIFFDILVWLPVKSLLRFKRVSKSWFSLISSPLFIKTHLEKQSCLTEDTRLIFSSICTNRKFTQCSLNSALWGTETEATQLNFPTKFRSESINIVGSCNGLLCIASKEQRVVIWNPSIRKYKTLPFDHGLRSSPRVRISYGFGYDNLNDDYKVVKFSYHGDQFSPSRPAVRIYSTKRNSWRRVEYHLNCGSRGDITHGIFLNGKIHWIMEDLHNGMGRIITFDLANEKYGEIQVPETSREENSILEGNLGVLGDGCLSLSFPRDENRGIIDVWTMFEYGTGESWRRVTSIHLPRKDSITSSFSKPVLVSKEGQILFLCRRELALWNPKKHRIRRKLGISHGIRCGVQWLRVDIYNESLVWFEEEVLKEFRRLEI